VALFQLIVIILENDFCHLPEETESLVPRPFENLGAKNAVAHASPTANSEMLETPP
jgi:hypothetical protein